MSGASSHELMLHHLHSSILPTIRASSLSFDHFFASLFDIIVFLRSSTPLASALSRVSTPVARQDTVSAILSNADASTRQLITPTPQAGRPTLSGVIRAFGPATVAFIKANRDSGLQSRAHLVLWDVYRCESDLSWPSALAERLFID